MESKDLIAISIIFFLPLILVSVHYLTGKHRSVGYFKELQEKYSLTPGQNGTKNNFLSGFYRTRPISIEYVEPEGKKKIHTCLNVNCNNAGNFEFSIIKRKKSGNPYYLNGAYIFEDSEFDDMFFIQTNNLVRLKNMFDFNSRFKLEQVGALGFNGEIKLKGGTLTYLEPGVLNNDTAVMKLELVLHELCDLADAMKYDERLVMSN